MKDIFDAQDQIAKAIAERLRVTLGGVKDDRLVEQATPNVEAYQIYLKGRALLTRWGASIPPALDLFRKAVELDPGYSQAWAGIAGALTRLAITGCVRGSESKPQAIAAATRSIELDPTSAVGHTALACAILLYESNRTRARQEFERDLGAQSQLRPGPLLVRALLFAVGSREVRAGHRGSPPRARNRSAVSLRHHDPRKLSLHCGRMDEAIETARQSVRLDPESFVALWGLVVALETAGRFEEAVSTLESGGGMSGRQSMAFTSLAGAFGQWGKRPEASGLYRELVDCAARGYVPASHLAVAAEAAGQREEAPAFARRAWDEQWLAGHAGEVLPVNSLRSSGGRCLPLFYVATIRFGGSTPALR